MSKVILIVLALAFTCMLYSITLTVKLDGTGDYTSIQSAIDGCNNGDTILVYPGRYLENLNLNHKQNITLASLEFSTGNASYIGQTIIDGHNTDSCIKIKYGEQNILIQGFSIVNGDAQIYSIAPNSFGGGIFIINQSRVTVKNCSVHNNTAMGGGGIYNDNSFLYLSKVSIKNNRSEAGGGIFCYRSHIVFDQINLSSVYSNSSGTGMDIWLSDMNNHTDIVLDTVTVNPSSRFYIGCQNQIFDNTTISISALHGIRQEINHDLYVSPDGNDQNTGLTPFEPLKTISWAMQVVASDSLNPKKVFLAPGIYSDLVNQQVFPIPIKSHVSIMGENEETTVIRNGALRHTLAGSYLKNFSLTHVALTTNFQIMPGCISLWYADNIRIEHIIADSFTSNFFSFFIGERINNLIFDDIHISNATENGIGCMYVGYSNFIIKNSTFDNINAPLNPNGTQALLSFGTLDSLIIENTSFTNCTTYSDGGSVLAIDDDYTSVTQTNSKVRISNCLFSNNYCDRNPIVATLTYFNMDMDINNCTFINNVAHNLRSTIILANNTTITNSIFDNSTEHEITFVDNNGQGDNYMYDLYYNDIEGGQAATNEMGDTGHVTWHEGNLHANPNIIGGDVSNPLNYRLNFNSPCINTGTPDTTGLFLPEFDLNGSPRIYDGRIDIGCYEWDGTAIEDQITPPLNKQDISIYPNPFRTTVHIDVAISKADDMQVSVYNIRGQLVKTLFSGKVKAGLNLIQWNGMDNLNSPIASGVYIARISKSGLTISRKLMMVK